MSAVPFRYRRAGYVALNVTDIDRTHEFATEIFSLSYGGEGPVGERYYRVGTEHHSMVLYRADEPGLVRFGWELEAAEDVTRAYAHCEELGLSPRWLDKEERVPLGLALSEAFRIREPINGVCFEYYSRMQTVPSAVPPKYTKFRRIAHIGVGVDDVRASSQYLLDNLGFRASDIIGDFMVCFMRPFPVADHHGFGYLPSRTGQPQFNHVAFLVDSIDDIGRLFNRIEAGSVSRAFGIGRHPTSDSIHLYINDPDGMLWEYSLGMEQFPEEGAREARFMSSAPEDLDLWDAKPKPSFSGAGNVITTD